jgi:LPXTG-motif cell wall-anchored protein
MAASFFPQEPALAYTGLNAGAGMLTALGISLIGVALIALVRRNPATRP